MPTPKRIRPPEYQAALDEFTRRGAAHASDKALMASFCEHNLQILVGAASEILVWQGAQKQGLTTRQLNDLCLKDPHAVHELMWII